MAAEIEKSDFKKRLEKKNDFHFIERWNEGQRPFDWYAEWRSLSACIGNYHLDKTFERA